jgi:hypoxanthine phosphoribosyltransferase
MVRDVNLSDIGAVTNALGVRVQEAGFRPDCIVYLETGARLMAAILCDRFHVPAVPLQIQRKSSRIKEWIRYILRSLPDRFKDGLRRAESHWRLNRKTGRREITTSAAVNLNGLRVLIVDDAVDTGSSVRLARKWATDMGASREHIKVAAIAATTDVAAKETDFHLFEELCRFPWSSDSREHEMYSLQYRLTSIPQLKSNEPNKSDCKPGVSAAVSI